jgi:secondary thiamine-phosphate synthase enzyme
VDVTELVERAVADAGVQRGEALIFVPHTTAGVTINENADPSVTADIIGFLSELVPAGGDYEHAEGNSDAHIKASLMGSSVRVIVQDGRLLLGRWQGIYFCEFDGPRQRQLWVSIHSRDGGVIQNPSGPAQ